MPRESKVYAPHERPAVEVLVDGQWLYGVLRMWKDGPGGWVADVMYFPPGETSGHYGDFPEDQVRPDTVDRSYGRG